MKLYIELGKYSCMMFLSDNDYIPVCCLVSAGVLHRTRIVAGDIKL